MQLNQGWQVQCISAPHAATLTLDWPNDVHSALLADQQVPDPYWRDNEPLLDWVHESEWLASRTFVLEDLSGRYTLSFDALDCIASIRLNGVVIGECRNQFLRQDFDVSEYVQRGENRLEVLFHSNSATARQLHDDFPVSIPYIRHNCRIAHYNFLRKTQCHAGWDWGIALSPLGIYGGVSLQQHQQLRLDDVLIRQQHDLAAQRCRLEVELSYTAWVSAEVEAVLQLTGRSGGAAQAVNVAVYPGSHQVTVQVEIEQAELWWPAGEGGQTLYTLHIRLGEAERSLPIGLRQIELLTDPDEHGARFAFRINGREIFMRGANWIPADALPARITPETVRDLLQSARDAHMNMLRIWGGGQYEADWFYQQCSELGILVWQDFMFACNLYPGSDKDWLKLVRREAEQQVRRLSAHPCMALWCGDNELVGALNWFEESRRDRDRYLAMYDRLNHTLEQVIDAARLDIPFWPSSPSVGRLNFGDGWHVDHSGDMHFWDVWHEAKDFEHYRTVRPRFCSEFGFQSFPSMRVIESFTEPQDRNVSTAVMDVHQRNVGGNGRIVETLARYFRFPDGFAHMVYLSQVGQALAMQTAIEFWRSNKPRCMGTLFWQINDCWPVASWASLEYGGGWKLTHYLARRFFNPVLVTAQPGGQGADIVLWGINDLPNSVNLTLECYRVALSGAVDSLGQFGAECGRDAAQELARIPVAELGEDAFLHFVWRDATGKYGGENDYLPKRPKAYAFSPAQIRVEQHTDADGQAVIRLTSDRPALYVTWDHGGDAVYSDNCFTLLPGQTKELHVSRTRQSGLPAQQPTLWTLTGQTLLP